ncbi:MAG: hypothetical protein R3B70_47235 [Polyangiaceae bacterium]
MLSPICGEIDLRCVHGCDLTVLLRADCEDFVVEAGEASPSKEVEALLKVVNDTALPLLCLALRSKRIDQARATFQKALLERSTEQEGAGDYSEICLRRASDDLAQEELLSAVLVASIKVSEALGAQKYFPE